MLENLSTPFIFNVITLHVYFSFNLPFCSWFSIFPTIYALSHPHFFPYFGLIKHFLFIHSHSILRYILLFFFFLTLLATLKIKPNITDWLEFNINKYLYQFSENMANLGHFNSLYSLTYDVSFFFVYINWQMTFCHFIQLILF